MLILATHGFEQSELEVPLKTLNMFSAKIIEEIAEGPHQQRSAA